MWKVEPFPFWPKDPENLHCVVPHILVDVRGEEETLTVSSDEGNERSKSNIREAEKVVSLIYINKNKFPLHY